MRYNPIQDCMLSEKKVCYCFLFTCGHYALFSTVQWNTNLISKIHLPLKWSKIQHVQCSIYKQSGLKLEEPLLFLAKNFGADVQCLKGCTWEELSAINNTGTGNRSHKCIPHKKNCTKHTTFTLYRALP